MIESAVAISILVVSFAYLMEIVHNVYTEDKLARAARAAARAIALNSDADACAAIRRELGLADGFDCGATWTLTVDRGVGPGMLPSTPDADAPNGTGDILLVRIGWSRNPWSFGETTDGEEAASVPMVAIGLARCELALCGANAG